MKTITVVHLSEYKKLNSFEKAMFKFTRNKGWLFALIPVSLWLTVWLCYEISNFWYLLLYFVIYFFAFIFWAERYGRVSTSTNHCSSCNYELKYLGFDYYGYYYRCDNQECAEHNKEIEI